MYKKIQDAILKGDYLAAAQLCQQGLDTTPDTPNTGSLFLTADQLVNQLEHCVLDGDLDERLWHLINDPDKFAVRRLHFVSDTELAEAISDFNAVLEAATDSDLWEALSDRAKDTKAREHFADKVSVSELRRLVDALEG